ncbi:MAG TPA: ATP-grasp domain-containing protein [Symbiobacteriaceae bacterium]|jgi:cysteine synthase A
MPKRLLFVEANTTGTGMLALRMAQEQGLQPVFLTNKPSRYAGLSETGCAVLVVDTNDYGALHEVITANLQVGELEGIVTTSEFYLEVVAQLTEAFHLPGNSPAAMRNCRNKALTRQTLKAAGVHQPKFAVCRAEAELAAAVEAVGLPCVVKPADDTGSFGVLCCTTLAEVAIHAVSILGQHTNIRGQRTAGTVLVEEYLNAPEFSVEMFTWDGRTTCVGITQKSLTGFPYFVESRHIFPAMLTPEAERDIRQTVFRTLEAVGITLGATHTEVKLTPQGCAIVEINARLAGGMIPELVWHATGIDLLKQQIKSAGGVAPDLSVTRHRYGGIQFMVADAEGELQEIQGLQAARAVPGIEQVVVTAQIPTRVRPRQSAYDRLGFIIAAGDTHEDTVASLARAAGEIRLAGRLGERLNGGGGAR